jgi:hypothetical protein
MSEQPVPGQQPAAANASDQPVPSQQPATTNEQVPTDKRLELAYEAARETLNMQQVSLANLRTQANTLLATAALFTSFSVGIGLLHSDPTKAPVLSSGKGLLLLAVVAAIGFCVLSVLWPANWQFGPSAKVIMLEYYEGHDEASIRKHITNEMQNGFEANREKLRQKQLGFRLAAALLLVEVGLLIAYLSFWK